MPSPIRYAAVKRMLERCGYTLNRVKGSHHYFTKTGARSFAVPVHNGLVKAHYVKEIEKDCGNG